jgi:hypothetical protein
MLYACAALPLWAAYHIERVSKERWLLLQQPPAEWPKGPHSRRPGSWPSAGRALRELGGLLLLSLAASEAIVAALTAAGAPV